MNDLSTSGPIKRCTAKRTNGSPCRNSPIHGSNVCRVHGGSAPQVKRAAFVRLLMEADPAAAELISIYKNKKNPIAIRLRAIESVLDRGGISARQEIDIDLQVGGRLSVYDQVVMASTVDITGPKPTDWDESFDGPWEDFIRPRQPKIIDAEIVEDAEHERALDAHTEATERERAKRRRKRLNPELPPSVARGLPAPRSHSIEEDPRTRPKQPSPEEDITSGREAFLRERLSDDKKPRRTQRSRG